MPMPHETAPSEPLTPDALDHATRKLVAAVVGVRNTGSAPEIMMPRCLLWDIEAAAFKIVKVKVEPFIRLLVERGHVEGKVILDAIYRRAVREYRPELVVTLMEAWWKEMPVGAPPPGSIAGVPGAVEVLLFYVERVGRPVQVFQSLRIAGVFQAPTLREASVMAGRFVDLLTLDAPVDTDAMARACEGEDA